MAGFNMGFTPLYWAYACLSEDTKILTENGLKGMNELKDGVVVYAFDIEYEKLVKTKVNKKIICDYKGKVRCIQTDYSNFVAWRDERYFITGNSGFPNAPNIGK